MKETEKKKRRRPVNSMRVNRITFSSELQRRRKKCRSWLGPFAWNFLSRSRSWELIRAAKGWRSQVERRGRGRGRGSGWREGEESLSKHNSGRKNREPGSEGEEALRSQNDEGLENSLGSLGARNSIDR